MTRPLAVTLSPLLFLLLVPTRVDAWGNKEHIQLTRIAAERLIADPATPEPMRRWLLSALAARLDMDGERDYFLRKRVGIIPRDVDGLPYWATMPDMAVMSDLPSKKTEPWPVHERLLHFIDVEYFMRDEARRAYAHDGSNKPALADFPDDPADWRYARAGMLPFRVRECYQRLVGAVRAGRLTDGPGQYPRDEHAAKWAGYLAHYVQDNTQPQHATIDYKSQAYFADKRGAPNVHSEMEYRMNDDADDDLLALREEFWPLFVAALARADGDPIATSDDPWQSTLEVALASYDALPLIGLAAMAAAKQGGSPDKPQGPAADTFDTAAFFRFKGTVGGHETTVMAMKARQQAWAVRRTERLWLRAWNEAQRPAPSAAPASRPATAP